MQRCLWDHFQNVWTNLLLLKDTHDITDDSWSNAENPSIEPHAHEEGIHHADVISRFDLFACPQTDKLRNVMVAFQPTTSATVWRQRGNPNKASSKSFCHVVGNN